MERTVSGIGAATVGTRRDAGIAKARSPRDFESNPRPRGVNRSLRAAAAFADDLRRDLNPRGPLERLLADHVVQSAWRLRAALDRRGIRDSANEEGPAPKRPSPNAADRAARSVREAVESLDYLRSRAVASPSRPIRPVEVDFEPNEWPIVPDPSIISMQTEPVPEPDHESDDRTGEWSDRLVFDFDVSDSTPIVKGTWITVGHVVSEIVDGSTWADILRTHPELSEEDIRACLAYAIAEEG